MSVLDAVILEDLFDGGFPIQIVILSVDEINQKFIRIQFLNFEKPIVVLFEKNAETVLEDGKGVFSLQQSGKLNRKMLEIVFENRRKKFI